MFLGGPSFFVGSSLLAQYASLVRSPSRSRSSAVAGSPFLEPIIFQKWALGYVEAARAVMMRSGGKKL